MKPNELLNRLYREIEQVILSRQNPVTGLLPASTAVNSHGDYTDAWVRDNVYSIMCVWALGIAMRNHGEMERADRLAQASIKLMRGLLQSMMRQAHKVERFKHTLNPSDALHAKYDTATGLAVVADHAWGHLQLDATSLYLLMLAQMSASGLRIVTTYDEVDFVQNLIYYIASAYRTPDFGIWERGNKINNGNPEINASSVGMAKAALQALDGFNLFGKNASPRSVVHTVADSVSLARTTLASLLPRESLSKEVDSALLGIIGFPAFAIGDETLASKTRDEILTKLGGNYGCKRFLWDGHQTVVEDASRIYYQHSELANFENIESEWPLFYTYLYIDALFNDNETTAQHYRKKIENLMVNKGGIGLIPELYYLPQEAIAKEKQQPRSQARTANDNLPLVWAQSLYYTGLLMDEGLVSPNDLDKLKMRRRATRFVQTQIALVVLAENEQVKQTLTEHGVIAETIDDIAPMGVISAPHLVEAYSLVGANRALNLSGRPKRRLQSLSTAQTYELNGKRFLCLSWLQSDQVDYRSYDAKRTGRKIEKEIAHIRKHWLNAEVAVFTFMMEQRLCATRGAEELYATLRNLQLRNTDTSVGYASANLAYRASRQNNLIVPDLCLTPLRTIVHSEPQTLSEMLPENLCSEFASLVQAYGDNDLENYQRLSEGLAVHGARDAALGGNGLGVDKFLQVIYQWACRQGHWLTARYCFSRLNLQHNVLADGMVLLSSRHMSVVIGSEKKTQLRISSTLTNDDVVNAINSVVDHTLERTLVQETLAIVGSLVRTVPTLFDGLRSLQVHNLLVLCAASDEDNFSSAGVQYLAALSPSDFLQKVWDILQSQQKIFNRGVKLGFAEADSAQRFFGGAAELAKAIDPDWLEWRAARGMITRFHENFLKDIWQSLSCADQLVFGDSSSQDCTLDCDLTRSSMTAGEESFAHLIDRLTQHVHPPYYKSVVVEALYAFKEYCKLHPQVKFHGAIDFSAILEGAAQAFVDKVGMREGETRNMDVFIEQSPFVVQEYLAKMFSNRQKQ